MSLRTMTRVWDHSQHRGTKLVAMLALADWANDEDIAWPKIKTLARKCRLTSRPCQTLLRGLEQSGELWTHFRTGRTYPNFYLVATALKDTEIASRLVDYLSYEPSIAAEIGALMAATQAGQDNSARLFEISQSQHELWGPEVRAAILKDREERVLKTAPLETAPRGAENGQKGAENSTLNHEPPLLEPQEGGGGKVNQNDLAAALITFFSEKSGLPEPSFSTIKGAKAANRRWKQPLLAMAALVDYNEGRTQTLIGWALSKADTDGWGDKVRAPASILSTCEGEVARRRRLASQKARERSETQLRNQETEKRRLEAAELAEADEMTADELALRDFWNQALDDLELQMTADTFRTWLQPTRVVSRESGLLVVQANTQAGAEWLAERLKPTIVRTVQLLTGGEVHDVDFVVAPEPG